jgi:hypothetical protein
MSFGEGGEGEFAYGRNENVSRHQGSFPPEVLETWAAETHENTGEPLIR